MIWLAVWTSLMSACFAPGALAEEEETQARFGRARECRYEGIEDGGTFKVVCREKSGFPAVRLLKPAGDSRRSAQTAGSGAARGD